MSGFIELDVDSREVAEVFGLLEAKLQPAGIMGFLERRAWPILRTSTERRFDTEGDDASGKWAELTMATHSYRREQGFPPAHPINVRTGALKAYALTHVVEDQKSGVVLTQPQKGGARLTQTKFKYAQKGDTTKRWGKYPPRPVVALGAANADEIKDKLFVWIEGGSSVNSI